MHHDVRYDLSNPAEAQDQAMKDIEEWLGDRFSTVEATVKRVVDGGCPFDEFQFAVSFVGIQGYPVKVWYQRLGGTIQ